MPELYCLCHYQDRTTIERQIATGQMSKREAAKIIGCSRDAISRHFANHVPELIKREQPSGILDVVIELTDLHRETQGIFNRALQDNNERLALKSAEVLSRC
jgi:hypothetical protein